MMTTWLFRELDIQGDFKNLRETQHVSMNL